MSSLRTKGKSTVVWLLMGLLLLGLGGFGITNFSGVSSGAIGAVGSAEIDSRDYVRGVRSDMQGFAMQTGQSLTAEQARAIGIPQQVQSRLFAAAALEAEARRIGLSVGDDVVLRDVTSAPAFQTAGGQFDAALYQDVLRREGLTPARFEEDVRMDAARVLLQDAVVGGVKAPATLRDTTARWILERRDFSWDELTAEDLAAPINPPDEETLIAWHQANAAQFTRPERRHITYAWLTPEMLESTVQLDDSALRDLYQSRIDEFQQPERRMVERLVYSSQAEAEAAKARLDAGEASFEQLAAERGLTLTDIDLGERAESELGAAGAALFALDQPGVVGPLPSDLGPALFSMNAILDPVDVSFEQAMPELRGEAAADRARRVIEEQAHDLEDLVAGGASVEDLAADTDMQLGEIEFSADTPSQGIAAYEAFRQLAPSLTEGEFLQLHQLDDGGLFALRLDQLIAPELIPFDEVRELVLADWTAAETRRELKIRAEERELVLESVANGDLPAEPAETDAGAGSDAAPQPAPPTFQTATDVERDFGIEGVPAAVVTRGFMLENIGDAAAVEAEGRVFLIRLDAIRSSDLSAPESQPVLNGVEARLTESVRSDLFDAYVRALQASHGATINDSALNAANAMIQ
ncbi:peptidylprolyl isomerase [Paracoccus alkenifer]|uniref:Peptidyl-prolyl cis-trans isomerase D n=1 Tax=Paracoccus alkenifer TaxID=65735 RepID=A0A1H6LBR8_9RHOB|nr:peptidylprolyl isomerase [Paracoccus alkenifer]SEH85729.1 peptidyl-prolyl cis-trans isomerase D [Paracoccus alkenifer]